MCSYELILTVACFVWPKSNVVKTFVSGSNAMDDINTEIWILALTKPLKLKQTQCAFALKCFFKVKIIFFFFKLIILVNLDIKVKLVMLHADSRQNLFYVGFQPDVSKLV